MQQPGDCFHLAFPMYDLEAGKDFYVQQLGFKLGRENKHAFIMNFYGHQVIAHRVSELPVPQEGIYPRHFGLNFSKYEDWLALVEKIKRNNITFFREPGKRFAGQFIEHDFFFCLTHLIIYYNSNIINTTTLFLKRKNMLWWGALNFYCILEYKQCHCCFVKQQD